MAGMVAVINGMELAVKRKDEEKSRGQTEGEKMFHGPSVAYLKIFVKKGFHGPA
jgi:hypothetical protein